MTQIKWGIIGLGNIANKFALALKSVDDACLHAVASRNPQKSQDFAQKHGATHATNYDTILTSGIDALYIALPNHLHKEWSIKALEAKVAVLCEKPSTLNTNEIKEVIETAKKHQTFYMEAMKTRFLPATQFVKEQLKTFGTPQLVYADFGFGHQFDPNLPLYNKDQGGGALMDVGVYPIAYTQDLFKSDTTAFHSTQTVHENGVDLSTSILIKTKADTHIHLFASLICDSPRDYRIIHKDNEIRVPRFSNATEVYIKRNGQEEHHSFPHLVNGLEYQIQEVHHQLKAGNLESPRMSWEDSIKLMEAVDQIKQ